ncbi:redoxin domain-containing protein [Mycobacterium sp. smrl_JER01]|uniref:redoxin domain-containing protein n=1 Tax=Mycobacterium sp. smrl_JER01 TaxID=3402633 RepID=UPI003AC38400
MTATEGPGTTAAVTMPRIGDPAPSFTAATTQGEINFPTDYLGKWVILFSHPADFTPVCTTEFITFASMQSEFRSYNTELVGLSVDGLYSHIAWLRTIKDRISYRDMRDVEVTFPLIDDVSMEVFDVATPADWRPGDAVIVPPAGSCGTAQSRMTDQTDGIECQDWFFCTRELPADEVESRIRHC